MSEADSATRFPADQLALYTAKLFEAVGLPAPRADVMARVLVEADLLGHVTHGLQLAPVYLGELEKGEMATDRDHDVIKDSGVIAVWDGHYLPGTWLTEKAVEDATAKARNFGTGTVVIRRSHHIACLASYLEAPARAGYVVEVSCVDPSIIAVPAHGGLDPIFTPNPIAVGIPTETDPVMIDLSASTTSMGAAALYRSRGDKLPGLWVQDKDGNATDDPNVLVGDEPGTILPTGGIDHGYKGFALALILETFTQGLSGLGRVDAPTHWGAATQVRVTDPEFFCGIEEFRRQSQHIVQICLESTPRDPARPVRLPGQSGLAKKKRNIKDGVPLSEGIVNGLAEWSDKLGIPLPDPNP